MLVGVVLGCGGVPVLVGVVLGGGCACACGCSVGVGCRGGWVGVVLMWCVSVGGCSWCGVAWCVWVGGCSVGMVWESLIGEWD